MRLLEFFHDYPPQTNPNLFRPKGTWTPPPHRDAALDTFLDAVEHDLFNVTPAPVRDNLTTRERHALKRLSRRNDIVIKSADKGSGTVVMDRNWYIDECLRQLNDSKFYKTLDKDITTDIQKRVQIYVQRMHRDQIIDDHTKRFLLQTDPKPGRFYILPKIHKQGNPGRPIVSSNSHPTERISQFVDYHLKLNKRGYNLSFLNQEIGRVNDITRSDALTNKDTPDTDQPTRVPLVITYNPALRPVSSIIHKHFNILSSSPRCANVFKATPLVAFRRTNNLSNLLVSAKLPNPTHNTPPHGSFLCGDNCLTCNYITDGRTSYTFHSTGETRLITHHIDCNSKNVIYMVHCNRCHKQYIGETKR